MKIDQAKKKWLRIPEVDFLRGFALLLMIFHHAIFDVRYVFQVDAFAFQDEYWFYKVGRPIILALFLFVSGISTRFSRNNLKRGIRMIVFSAIATVGTVFIHQFVSGIGIIFFNVIHVVAFSTLIYAFIEYVFIGRHGLADLLSSRDLSDNDIDEKKYSKTHPNDSGHFEKQLAKLLGCLIAFGALAVGISVTITPILPKETLNPLFVMLGSPVAGVKTLDQMPLLPFLGYYILGAATGHTLYASGEPLWKKEEGILFSIGRPVRYLGRNALFVYLLHQPITLAILWMLSKIGLF